MSSPQYVYLVVPEGIEPHNAAAVCDTRKEAEGIARGIWDESDGYHSFRIEQRRVGRCYRTFSWGSPERRRSRGTDNDEPEITFVPETEVTYP